MLDTKAVGELALDFADIVALDKDDRIALIGDVSAGLEGSPRGGVEVFDRFHDRLDFVKSEKVPYLMIVSQNLIHIQYQGHLYGQGGPDSSPPSHAYAVFIAGDILSQYDPGFKGKRIFWTYMTVLVRSWLSDLANHWKHEEPPGSERLTEIGLLPRLRGGSILIA